MSFLDSLFEILTDFAYGFAGLPPRSPPALVVLRPEHIQWEPWSGPDRGIFLGGARFPNSLDGHVQICGTTRAGKTTAIRLIMQDALYDVANPALNSRALIYDPKREMHGILAGMGLGDLTISLDPRHVDSHALHWPSYICDQESATRACGAVLPSEGSHDGTQYFRDALRALMRSVMVGLIDLHQQTGLDWSLRTVLNILEDESLVRLVAGRHHAGRKDIEAYLDGRSDTKLDLRGVTRNFLNDYAIIANWWHHAQKAGRVFSIDEWLTSNRILILPAPPPTDDLDPNDPISRLNRVLFGLIAEKLLQQSEARRQAAPQRIWIVIDEFRFAGKLPGLLTLFTQGASFGVRVVVGVHNLSGLQDALGKERASEVFDLTSIKAFYRAGNDETAKVMSDQFGQVREYVQNFSGGASSYSQVDRPLLLDEAFLNLPLPKYKPEEDSIVDLTGYYRIAGVPSQPAVFKSTLPMEQLYGPGGMIRPIAPGHEFRQRPAWQQEHIPFTAEELAALGAAPARPRRSAASIRKLPRSITKNLFRPRED